MLNIESGLYFCPSHWLNNNLRIALVGCGATGSAVAPLLFKLNHIRRELTAQEYGLQLSIFDPKKVTETGKNRTGFFSTEVGLNKAHVMANKLNNAYGQNFAYGFSRPFCPSDTSMDFDIVITATDSARSRYDIQEFMGKKKNKTSLWLDIGVEEQFGNVVLGEFGKGKHRLPNALDLFPEMAKGQHDDALKRNSCDVLDALTRQNFTVNEQGATTGVGLLSRLILNGCISVSGSMYDIEQCGSSPIRINREVWRSFGYRYRKPSKVSS
ncbi:PRTRC system ThiF family protein [uncultured Alteromonas sp.]|uniref:PRTRC system ThiF family protein n=1 Tax=uncultured Alteromonas sp. TaxID=179113 RepID=UPI0030D59E17|tara:strand:+ start:47120 stop:47926 length:807 start_codon:yes stop_codon:yes gene_type:complete